MRDVEVYGGAAVIGTLAGLRSMAAPAVRGQLSRRGALSEVTNGLSVVTRPGFSRLAPVLAVGEWIADKLPVTPNRTAVGPLLGRAFTGGLSGAVVCSAKRRSPWMGAWIGAAAAVGAAYGAYELRKRAGQRLHLPDTVVALAEDVLAGSLGAALASHLSAGESFA